MKFKAAIFDLEETLTHTFPECTEKIVELTFRDFGAKISESEKRRFWLDHRREEIIRRHGIDPRLFWEASKKHDTVEFRKQHIKIFDDVGFIREIRKKGLKTGIVTSSPVRIISFQTEMLGKENFDTIVRAQLSSGIKPKPDPHGILECLKILGVKSSEAIFVGNGDEDILTARAAGVLDVLIDRGGHNLIKETPSLKIKSLYELRGILGM